MLLLKHFFAGPGILFLGEYLSSHDEISSPPCRAHVNMGRTCHYRIDAGRLLDMAGMFSVDTCFFSRQANYRVDEKALCGLTVLAARPNGRAQGDTSALAIVDVADAAMCDIATARLCLQIVG